MGDDLLDMRFNGRTVRENLARAIADGKLTEQPDGTLSPPRPQKAPPWYLAVNNSRPLACRFLNGFLFNLVYDRSAVPFGCRTCFKVKAAPPTFRGLIALRGILEETPCHSKCGVDLYTPHSRDAYAGFLYLDGLAEARAAWRDLRKRVDAHPHLGPAVPLTIKRGCSNYEASCGPSDRWTFREGLPELEAALFARFRDEPPKPVNYRQARMTIMVRWLQVAYDLKDDTYLDFTGGKPLHPPIVSYPPEEPMPEEGDGSLRKTTADSTAPSSQPSSGP